jgi:RimJ/RimL family protein N-acetyltransferase
MRIDGRRVVLRDEPRGGDAEDLFRWLNLEEWNYYDEPDKPFEPVTREEFEVRRSRPRQPKAGTHTWHIDTLEGKHVGWVNYYHLNEKERYALVGVALPEPEEWGKGYGTEAVCLVIDYLFREMGIDEVRTQTWTGNERMIRVAQKCGLRNAGLSPHRAALSVRGEPLEFIHFSMSRAEWSVCGNDGA